MTNDQAISEMRRNTTLNKARAAFRSACGKIEQANQQRTRPSSIDILRMEFDAVKEIIEIWGA